MTPPDSSQTGPEPAPVPNPYAPPAPATGAREAPRPGFEVAHPERIRTLYYGREKAIRRVSWLNFALAVLWTPAAVGTVLMTGLLLFRSIGIDPASYQFPGDMPPTPAFLAITAFHVACLALNIAIGIGLRRFRPWARWAEVVVAALFLVVFLAYAADVLLRRKPLEWLWTTSVPAFIVIALVLWVLLSPRSNMVFSEEYREVVARTRWMS